MSPSSSPSPTITAAQIEAYLTTAASSYKSIRTHPRYNARWRSLVAIAVGTVLNFFSLIVAFAERWEKAPRWVTFWVAIVLSISLCYQLVDLTCNPPSISLTSSSKSTTTQQEQQQQRQTQKSRIFTRHIPAPFICAVDTLGFLGFLALLIANGIVVSDLGTFHQIYIYNSVPWVICCASHGFIALESFLTILSQTSAGGSGGGRQRDYCCAECKRESERRHGLAQGHGQSVAVDEEGATALLLRDVEGDAAESV